MSSPAPSPSPAPSSSLEAIDTWRRHPDHRRAKANGMSRWFTGYATRIAQVIDHY